MNKFMERNSSHRRKALRLSGLAQDKIKHEAIGCLVSKEKVRSQDKKMLQTLCEGKSTFSQVEVVCSFPPSPTHYVIEVCNFIKSLLT